MGITDVAREAGVSIATVSRVLNGSDYPVKPDTRARVLAASKKLDFRPNDLARGLLLKKTRTIGLIVPDIANPYYPALLRGIEDVASAELYSVLFCNTDRRGDKSEHCVNSLLQKRVDGIIVAGGGTDFTHASRTFAAYGAQVVLIGRHRAKLPSVQIDNVQAARGATDHLIDLGHRDIACVSGPLALTSFEDRLSGYRRSLEDHDIGWDDRLIREAKADERSGYDAALSLLEGYPRPTAIFAGNDRMAIGALAAASDLELDVPRDVSIAGIDDIAMASYVRPALTSVALPMNEIGATAMRLMLELLNEAAGADDGKRSPSARERTIRLPTRLVVRDSSGPASPAHEEEGVPGAPKWRPRRLAS